MDETEDTCTWLIESSQDEFGYATVFECGAPVTYNASGWSCASGHVHHSYGSLAWEQEQFEHRGDPAYGW